MCVKNLLLTAQHASQQQHLSRNVPKYMCDFNYSHKSELC